MLIDPNLPKPSEKPSQSGFALRDPLIAAQIGSFQRGSTNITTNTVRFSTRIGLQENPEHKGSEVNAYRHSLLASYDYYEIRRGYSGRGWICT